MPPCPTHPLWASELTADGALPLSPLQELLDKTLGLGRGRGAPEGAGQGQGGHLRGLDRGRGAPEGAE